MLIIDGGMLVAKAQRMLESAITTSLEVFMKTKVVTVSPMKTLIKIAPGFQKKNLADYKLDIAALCGFGCRYCSSNMGNYLRIHRSEFTACVEDQLGKAITPADDPSLMLVWPDVVSQLSNELQGYPNGFGSGKTLVFSMLTDGFSPYLVNEGITREVLELILKHTSFRIRVLTKNAVVGEDDWLELFAEYQHRFVVGLSTGSLDDAWSRRMELGTSSPSKRLEALEKLQEAGIPTYGMLCPIFPDMLTGGALESMIDRVNPATVEHIWAEPYNDRVNWRLVRDSYPEGSDQYRWFTDVFGSRDTAKWSKYATSLYLRLRGHAMNTGWMPKLRYLLYESGISQSDAPKYDRLQGVLLQGKPSDTGLSTNPWISNIQGC